MAYQPLATEVGAVYTLTGPAGTVAVFNDPASANYVGMLTEVTGLDSAEVRESAIELSDADGGVHGDFFLGRRPITLSGRVFGHASITERNARLDRARRASLGLRADSTLIWTPTGAQEVFVYVRRQQPFRESGAWVKDFQIPLVSERAIIQSTALVSGSTGSALENQGNWPAYPSFAITGTISNPTISDGTRTFRTTGLTLAAGETVEFDMGAHTGVFTAGARSGQSANQYINFTTTEWPYLTGNGTSQTFTRTPSGATVTVRYRHTWA
jgi:hypothetical protein